MPVDPADIAGTLRSWSLTFVEPGSAEFQMIPEQWRPIALSTDPEKRRQTALKLWNQSFLDLIPRFATALSTRFIDVRVCITDDSPVLVYVAGTDGVKYVSWVGYDPRTFGKLPQFWESFPEPLRVFLREVHAGFTSWDRTSFGPSRPAYMDTLANLADSPEGIPGWEDAEISPTRLLRITTDGGLLEYCLSPDLAPGEVALVYEGDIDPQDFGSQLDELMMSNFHG